MSTPRRGRAVAYYRVSTKSQMETDYDPDGNSIQTQREDCHTSAERYGYDLVDEYLEPGNTGTSITKRPVFQALLERITERGDVEAVFIYKRSRIFRDEWDAAITGRELQDQGVRLISATDYTDETAEGQLVASIIDSVNAYQSRALANDVRRKMAGKAARGGTPGRAKLGYLNTREHIDGRSVATVAIDPERGPFIATAFRLYATGQYGFKQLGDALAEAGLRNRPTKAHPAGTRVSPSQLEKILRDRYYLGYVIWRGEEHTGRHEPLVDPELFDRVQGILAARHRGTRARKWDHYLKGLLWCARCSRRLILEPARSHTGRVHFYWRCTGRQHHTCDLPRIPLADIEAAVEAHYATISISPAEQATIRQRLTDALSRRQSTTKALRQRVKTELTRLDRLEDQCLELLDSPEWPTEKLTERIKAIKLERGKLNQRLADADATDAQTAAQRINALLDLLARPRELFRALPDDLRKVLGALNFDKLYIDADDPDSPAITHDEPAAHTAPLRQYLSERQTEGHKPPSSNEPQALIKSAQGSNSCSMVGLTGFEPATPSSRTRCATKLRHNPIFVCP
jgi:site-specific DNA recombinase